MEMSIRSEAMKLGRPTYLFKRIQWIWHRTQVLRRIMPLWDSFKVALREGKKETVDVLISGPNQVVTVRLDTSDIKCLEQVFLDEEYWNPFSEMPRVIVDAGANIGMSTLYFASKFPAAQVIAIEPESSNFKILQANCGRLKNVTLIHAALWPNSEAVAVQDTAVDKWAFIVKKNTGGSVGSESVRSITIPDIFRRFGIEEIDFLKLDIEGAELDLFSSRTDEWIDRIGTIVIELHDRFRPGCARALYSALGEREFLQEVRGENIFIGLRHTAGEPATVSRSDQVSERVESAAETG
jgi:FkbM family methyltransferase